MTENRLKHPAATTAENTSSSVRPIFKRAKAPRRIAVGVSATALFLSAGTAAAAPLVAQRSPESTSLLGAGTEPSPTASGNHGAGPGRPFRPALAGTIASVGTSSLTVKTATSSTTTSTVTVDTTSSTSITESTSGALTDLADGQTVTVLGSEGSSTAAVAARRIIIGKTPSSWGALGSQTGPAPSGNGRQGPPSRGPTGSAPSGSTPGNGRQRPPSGGGAPSVFHGTVSSLSDGAFTVVESNGDRVAVTATSSTKVATVTTVLLSRLQVGQTVQVIGTSSSDGVITASGINEGTLRMGPSAMGGPGGYGRGPGVQNPDAG